jgi:DNA-binding MarR family transcriptional regulator
VVVDDLETKGLVRRRPHPTDRRAKLVEVTRKGENLARRAEAVLSTPPASLTALSLEDLERLVDIVERSSPARAPADELRSG